MYGSEQCLLKKNVRNIVHYIALNIVRHCPFRRMSEHCALYCTKHCLDNMGTLSLDCHLKKNVCLSNIVEKNNLKKIVYFALFLTTLLIMYYIYMYGL